MHAIAMEYSSHYNTISKKIGYFDDFSIATSYLTFLSSKKLVGYIAATMSVELLEFIKLNIPVKIFKKFKKQKTSDHFSASLSIDEFQKIRNKIPGKKKIQNWYLHIENDITKTIKKNKLNSLDKTAAKKIAKQLFSAADAFATDIKFKIEEIKIILKPLN